LLDIPGKLRICCIVRLTNWDTRTLDHAYWNTVVTEHRVPLLSHHTNFASMVEVFTWLDTRLTRVPFLPKYP
jgi:hypothetical protein